MNYKAFRRNIENFLKDFRAGKAILRYKITNQKEKNDKFNYIKIKNSSKDTMKREGNEQKS